MNTDKKRRILCFLHLWPSVPHLWLILLLSICSIAHAKDATTLPALFDPARHMRVRDVRAGMRGYGLSVFKGTKVDRFEVEVLSVLRDFNPQYDVILVNCKGANLEHTGSIAGMSGSPIFLGEAGKEKMVGAFAYGWPLMKDPVGGVQPIEYMLGIEPRAAAVNPPTQPATTQSVSSATRWDIADAVLMPGMAQAPASWPFASLRSTQPNPALGGVDENVTRLRPLATPLMTSGFAPKMLDQLAPLLKSYNLVPLQAGGIRAGKASGEGASDKFEPGGVLCVPLLTGDFEMTAVGTCTEVIGDRVIGFGHPFNNEGPVALPVGNGEINGVIANLMTSFKLGAINQTLGTLYADETVGVAGTVGKQPPLIPIHLTVTYTDGSGQRDYRFNAAWHPRLTPLICASAITGAVTGVHDLPEFHTIDYDVQLEFANGEKIKLANSIVNAAMPELFFDFGTPMVAASQNPFEQVSVKEVRGNVRITPKARDATILWVNVPRLKFRPGETLKAYVTYRPFRSGDVIMPVNFELPRDLPEGTYQFTISGWEQFLSDERTAKPFRFSAESIEDVFGVLRDITSFRHDAMYMRLIRQPDGIAIGRTAMRSLPSSRREVLLGAGRSNTTPFVNSTTKVVAAKHLMAGAAQFEITIDKNAHIETGVGKPPRHESPPQPPAPPKPETPTIPGVQPGSPIGSEAP
jgi:hypothetical protein